MKSGHWRIFFYCGGSNALDKERIFLLVKTEKNQLKSWMKKSASAPLDAKNSLS